MRIAYVTDQPLPSRSANSVHVMKMCQAFARLGHDVTLLVPHSTEPGFGDPFLHYGVETCFTIRRVPWHPRTLAAYWYGLLAAILAKLAGVELIYGRSHHACLVGSLIGVPVCYDAHRLLSQAGPGSRWIFSRLARRRRFVRLVATSQALSDAYRKLGLPSERIVLARNAADEPQAVELFEFAASERLQVGYTGHLYPGKGMEIIVPLAAACPWADFHVVGGTAADLAYWQPRSDGQSNLIYHGFVSPAVTDRYRLSCHVLLAPYQRRVLSAGGTDDRWTSPMKLFEYMAAGKAILCSDLPLLREILVDEEAALFCDSEDPQCWMAALERLRDNEFRSRLAVTTRQIYQDRYTWKARAESVLAGVTLEDET